MGNIGEMIREPARLSGPGASRHDLPGNDFIAVATVGHEGEVSDRWISEQSGQILVEITYRTPNPGQRGRARVSAGFAYLDLVLGEQVVIAKVGGNDTHGVIFARVNDLVRPLPARVAGIDTGPEAPQRGDQSAGPAFSFLRTRPGRMLAVQTGALADVLVHSGAGVEIRGGAIHLDGAVHLGSGFTTPPVPPAITATDIPDTGAGAGVLPGAPGAPHVPIPSVNPTTPPYAGPGTGVVRAKDRYQATFAGDPGLFLWLTVLDVFLKAVATLNPVTIAAATVVYNAVPMPTSITSAAMSASLRVNAADGP